MEAFVECERSLIELFIGTGKILINIENIVEWLYVQIIKFDDWNLLCFGVLLIFIIFQAKNYKKNKVLNKKLNIFCLILGILTVVFSINFDNSCTMNVVQRNWGTAGATMGIINYDIKVKENDVINEFKILKIEEDGVLVEYEKISYITKTQDDGEVPNSNGISVGNVLYSLSNYDIKKEVVTQKLLWNTLYEKKESNAPDDVMAEGGIEYYYKLKK